MDRNGNFESFRGRRTRRDSRRANSVNSNNNSDNNSHSDQGIEGDLSRLSLSDNSNSNYLNSGSAFVAGGENGSFSRYNGENGSFSRYNGENGSFSRYNGENGSFSRYNGENGSFSRYNGENGSFSRYNGENGSFSRYNGENGSFSRYNGENFYFLDGVEDYYNTDVPVQDFIGVSNYFPVPPAINGNMFNSSNINGLYNGYSLQGPGSQYFNHNGTYERNFFATSRGYSPRNSVEPFPPFHRNRHGRHGGGLTIDPRGVNANMNLNVGVSARNWALPLGFEGISLSDLRGKIVALATDQTGCRILQSLMDNIDEGGVAMILAEVIDWISELMVDEFGNYIVQKLLDICSDEQKNQILLSVTRINFQLVRICVNMHGTRVVQKLLKHLTSRQQISLVISALMPGAVLLIKDINGHHVIDFCVKHFSTEDIELLLNEVLRNCYALATDRNGCCVMQTIIKNPKGEARELIVAELIQNSRLLSADSYGNYVVQHAIELREPGITRRLFRELKGHFFTLARNKYGSNVVEKFLIDSGVHATEIITELLRSPNASILLTDPYGNFVIQRALSVTQVGPLYKAIVNLIEMNASAMQCNLFGKKILSRCFRRRQPAH